MGIVYTDYQDNPHVGGGVAWMTIRMTMVCERFPHTCGGVAWMTFCMTMDCKPFPHASGGVARGL